MELATELEACLKELSAAGAVEIRENGGRVAPFSGASWEVRGAAEKPLLHLWSEYCNLTRRVLAISAHSDERLSLAVERFGRAKPDRLEFIRLEFERTARDLSRDAFCEFLGRTLAEKFPDESLDSLTVSPDLEHSLSGNYVRGLLRRGSTYTAVLGVPGRESTEASDLSLIVSTKLFSIDRDLPSIPSSKSLRAPSPFILRRNHVKFGFVFAAWFSPAGRTAAFSSASRMPAKNSRLPLGQLSRICFATSKPTAIRLLATRAIPFTARSRSAGSSHWFVRMSRE